MKIKKAEHLVKVIEERKPEGIIIGENYIEIKDLDGTKFDEEYCDEYYTGKNLEKIRDALFPFAELKIEIRNNVKKILGLYIIEDASSFKAKCPFCGHEDLYYIGSTGNVYPEKCKCGARVYYAEYGEDVSDYIADAFNLKPNEDVAIEKKENYWTTKHGNKEIRYVKLFDHDFDSAYAVFEAEQ